MTSAEFTRWKAFERVHGPLLIHERLEAAVAILSLIVVKVWTGKALKPADVLPRWDQGAANEDSVWTGFQKLVAMAEGGNGVSRPSKP